MEINKKLRAARMHSQFTQEQIAEQLQVSRQTISNWETGKSYPDIVSVITLSDIYQISVDELVKGDAKMLDHLQESTNIVSSNKKLITAIVINIIMLILIAIFNSNIEQNVYLLCAVLSIFIISTTVLFYQIIRRF